MNKKVVIIGGGIDGLEGVYFAGHRMMPPGGLPIAVLTAHMAVEQMG